jgi:hypothetical protein
VLAGVALDAGVHGLVLVQLRLVDEALAAGGASHHVEAREAAEEVEVGVALARVLARVVRHEAARRAERACAQRAEVGALEAQVLGADVRRQQAARAERLAALRALQLLALGVRPHVAPQRRRVAHRPQAQRAPELVNATTTGASSPPATTQRAHQLPLFNLLHSLFHPKSLSNLLPKATNSLPKQINMSFLKITYCPNFFSVALTQKCTIVTFQIFD